MVRKRSITGASAVQRQFWLLHQLNPESPAYTVASVFRIRGRLDARRLVECVNSLLRKHAVLRSSFCISGGDLVQVLLPYEKARVSVDECVKEGIVEPDLDRLTRDEISRPFDLETGPLFRLKLLSESPEKHVLIITMHHSIIDLHGKEIFGAQLSSLYNGSGVSAEAAAVDTNSYAHYAQWQNAWFKSEKFLKMVSYWKHALKDFESVLSLPLDHVRPPYRTLRGSAVGLDLPDTLTQELRRFCRDHSVNSYLALLSIYFTLLYRYTGQDRIVVGVPLTNRRQDEYKDTMGCFVNTVPVLIDIKEDTVFMDLVGSVRKAMLEAHRHQEVPLEEIVKALGMRRDPSYNAVYQAGYTFEHPMALDLNGLSVEPVYIHHGGSQLDLFMTFWESAEGVRGFLEYDTDLFDAGTAERLSANFKVALSAAIRSPEERLSRLSILTEEEEDLVVRKWNATEKDYSGDCCLGDLIDKQSAKTPDAIAVTYGETDLSYSELQARTNLLAAYLRSRGVGPDVLVAVFMERSIEMVVALVGIVKAGGAYVPVDPEYPAARVGYMLRDAKAKVVLTQQHLLEKLPEQRADVLCLDSEWAAVEAVRESPLPGKVTGENLAYVIYTSGSTGNPKGAMNTHAGVCNQLFWMQETYGLTEDDRVLQKTPYSFDVSVWEFFWPLSTGARIVIAPPKSHRDPSALVKLINGHAISTIHFVPSMLHAFLQDPQAGSCGCLKRVFCSGEALPPEVRDTFFEIVHAELYNLYGPTEAAVDVSYWQCKTGTGSGSVPIGRPVANTQLYILDKNLQPVAIGVCGELYIGGVQVGRGYLNNQELTRQCFLSDPFAGTPGGTLYRTGDVARYLPTGALEYIGRVDFQVKIRGNRIELGEIEKSLAKHPQINEVVVVAGRENTVGKRLEAFIVPHSGQQPATAELRKFLLEQLPEFMVPSIFVFVPAFPRTTNGKIRRDALTVPAPSVRQGAKVSTAPSTPTEKALAGLWRGVLGSDRIGIHDNFFYAGGNSLLSVQMADLVQKRFKTEVSTVNVFQYPTIGSMAHYIDNTRENSVAFSEVHKRTQQRKAALTRRKKSAEGTKQVP